MIIYTRCLKGVSLLRILLHFINVFIVCDQPFIMSVQILVWLLLCTISINATEQQYYHCNG